MLLAQPSLFTRDHYEAHKGVAPAHLCELVVHCLELVSQLSHRDLVYRFKGGNSLLLLLEAPERFSIDVDIVTVEPKERLVAVVEQISDECDVFVRWEARQPKTKPWLPLISFKLFFESVYQPPEDAFVMLDAVLEPPPYPGVTRQVRCGSLYESAEHAEVPSVSGLIGDKLLAIGPSTLGIPLGKQKEAQRLKHLFDVALLAAQGFDPEQVKAALVGCQDQEERIQGSRFTWDEIRQDTARFCGEPLAHPEAPALDGLEAGSYLHEIVLGFEQFRRHLFRLDYGWPAFQQDCRRVLALLEML